jgi:hypothetical protein
MSILVLNIVKVKQLSPLNLQNSMISPHKNYWYSLVKKSNPSLGPFLCQEGKNDVDLCRKTMFEKGRCFGNVECFVKYNVLKEYLMFIVSFPKAWIVSYDKFGTF